MPLRASTIFLDRDGIINRSVIKDGKPYPPFSVGELEIIPGAITSIENLARKGYTLIGVTNQPDVARARQKRENVEAINAQILKELPIKEIFTCYHDDEDNCLCRKPKPGLILQAAEKYGSDLFSSWMIGDRWKDISAGKSVGLKTVFVEYHYNESYHGPLADYTIYDMKELEEIILHLS